jgi:hypothetical protein
MSQSDEVGFFKSLFDFKFKSFITMRVIRVIYAILVVLTILFGVLLFISVVFLNDMYYGYGNGMRLLLAMVVPLGTILYLIILRLWAEFMANIYRIGDNTQKMVDSRIISS